MKDWLILLCIGIVAVFAFHERDLWRPRKASPANAVSVDSAPPPRLSEPPPPPPPPMPPPAEEQLAPKSPEKAELAVLVRQSQQQALTKYPALGEATSEINIRFNDRYKRMLAEYSPRLQNPAWPVQLADECAEAAGIRPVATHSAPAPAPPVVASQTASMPPGSAPLPGEHPPQALRASPLAPAAQTLAFHPATGHLSQAPPVAAPSAVSVPPPPSGALPFVTMDAVNQSSGNNYTYNWGSYYGWYDISYRQTVGIAINLRNMSRSPAALNLRWIFFARNPRSNERFIFAAAGKELDLPPGESASVAAASPLIQSREVNYYGWIGDRYMYGSKYEGWLVQLLERDGNRVIKQTGSTSYLEDLAKGNDFAAFVEAYHAKVHSPDGAGL